MNRSDPFRLHVVRSGGAVHQLGVLLLLVPAPVAGSAEVPAHPSPTRDAASFGDSRRNNKTGFAARRLPRRRSHDPGTRAEWNLSRAPRRPAATAIEEQRVLPQCSCPLPAPGRCRRKSYRDRAADSAGFDQTEAPRAVAVPSIPVLGSRPMVGAIRGMPQSTRSSLYYKGLSGRCTSLCRLLTRAACVGSSSSRSRLTSSRFGRSVPFLGLKSGTPFRIRRRFFERT